MSNFSLLSSKQKKIYTMMLFLSLAGVFVTTYLIYIHFKPAGAGSFCNLDDYWNCDRVNQSPFAEIFGIPMSFLGFGFYALLSVLLIGLIKNYKYWRGELLTSKWFFSLTAIISVLMSIGLIFLEFKFSKALYGFFPIVSIIRNLLVSVLIFLIHKKYKNNDDQITKFTAWLGILTLFGVNFSLYLTGIEFFVLEAICVFCITQQVLIILICILNFHELKQLNNGKRTITTIKV